MSLPCIVFASSPCTVQLQVCLFYLFYTFSSFIHPFLAFFFLFYSESQDQNTANVNSDNEHGLHPDLPVELLLLIFMSTSSQIHMMIPHLLADDLPCPDCVDPFFNLDQHIDNLNNGHLQPANNNPYPDLLP